jgi:tRNA G18 (ribose-2'-O)-methylase SpoU
MGRVVRKTCTRLVRLHQSGIVQSLNASVAAGISLYALSVQCPRNEALRQQMRLRDSIE